MYLAHSKCSVSISCCYMLLYVSIIIHTGLLKAVTSFGVKLERGCESMEKKTEIKTLGTKEDIRMADKHMKKCPTANVTGL